MKWSPRGGCPVIDTRQHDDKKVYSEIGKRHIGNGLTNGNAAVSGDRVLNCTVMDIYRMPVGF